MRTLVHKTCLNCTRAFTRNWRSANRPDQFCSKACHLESRGRPKGTGDPRLTATERLVRYYTVDCALCSCAGTLHAPSGLMCIPVGRDRSAMSDRCLECGETWTVREYRWQPATRIARAA